MSIITLSYIHPRWLTMVPGWGECCICSTPDGYTHLYYLNIKFNSDDKYGFLVCGKESCNLHIKHYIHKLKYNVYTTKTWRRILNIYANNLFVTVERTNGDIEHDWVLDNDCDHDSNKIPLSLSFLYAILCTKKLNETNDTNDTNSFPILPNEIWEYIYDICLDTYRDNINLTFTPCNKKSNTINSYIRVKKGEIYKKIQMELL